MKTREEVEKLKQDWVSDPCWDIEDTTEFEEYRTELLKFSRKMKRIWNREKAREHAYFASKLCPMMFNAPTSAENVFFMSPTCRVEQCAWWNEQNKKCSIRVMSMENGL